MAHIIRGTDLQTCIGEGLWPGMWVNTGIWKHPRAAPSPLDACFLWRVEQHDQVMVLVAQGADAIVPLTPELAWNCNLFRPAESPSLSDYPIEWAALRKLGWGVYMSLEGHYQAHCTLTLSCRRGYKHAQFWLPQTQFRAVMDNPEIVRSLLKTSWWRLKHPRYADALASQQPREFWDWPNAPDLKQLHAMGLAAWKTVEGSVEISPDGKLTATGRKRWEFPDDETE